jgi:hypothetical protein
MMNDECGIHHSALEFLIPLKPWHKAATPPSSPCISTKCATGALRELGLDEQVKLT